MPTRGTDSGSNPEEVLDLLPSFVADSVDQKTLNRTYNSIHPVILPSTLPSVTVHHRPSTLSGIICRPRRSFISASVIAHPQFPESSSLSYSTQNPTGLEVSIPETDENIAVDSDNQNTVEEINLTADSSTRFISNEEIRDLKDGITSEETVSDAESEELHFDPSTVKMADNPTLHSDLLSSNPPAMESYAFTPPVSVPPSVVDPAGSFLISAEDLLLLKRKISDLESRISEKERAFESEQKKTVFQESRMKDLSKTITDLRHKLSEDEVEKDQSDGVISALKSKVTSLQIELEQTKQEKNRLASEKSPSKINVESLTLERDFLQEQVGKLKKEQQQLNADLQRIVDERLTDRLQYDSLRRENAALSQKLQDVQHNVVKEKTALLKQLETMEAEQRNRETEIVRLSMKEAETKKSANNIKMMNDAEWKRLSDLVKKVDVLEIDLTASKTENQSLRETLLDVEKDRKDLLRRVVVAEKMVEERDATIEFLNRRLQASNTQASVLNERQNQLEKELQEFKRSNVEIVHMRNVERNLTAVNGELNARLTMASNSIRETEDKLRKTVQEVESVRREKSSVEEKLQASSETLSTLQNQLWESNSSFQSLQTELVNYQSSFQSLQAFSSNLQTENASSKAAVDSLQSELSSTKPYVDQLEQEVSVVRTELVMWKERSASLETQLDTLRNKPTVDFETQTDIDSSNETAENLANDYAVLSELYEQQKNEVDQLRETLNQSAAVIEEWNSAYGQLAKDRDGKSEKIVTLSTKIARLEEAVALNEATVVELQTEREKLAGNLQQSELLVGKLNAEISDISARYAAVMEVNDQMKSEHEERIVVMSVEKDELQKKYDVLMNSWPEYEATWNGLLENERSQHQETISVLQNEVARLNELIAQQYEELHQRHVIADGSNVAASQQTVEELFQNTESKTDDSDSNDAIRQNIIALEREKEQNLERIQLLEGEILILRTELELQRENMRHNSDARNFLEDKLTDEKELDNSYEKIIIDLREEVQRLQEAADSKESVSEETRSVLMEGRESVPVSVPDMDSGQQASDETSVRADSLFVDELESMKTQNGELLSQIQQLTDLLQNQDSEWRKYAENLQASFDLEKAVKESELLQLRESISILENLLKDKENESSVRISELVKNIASIEAEKQTVEELAAKAADEMRESVMKYQAEWENVLMAEKSSAEEIRGGLLIQIDELKSRLSEFEASVWKNDVPDNSALISELKLQISELENVKNSFEIELNSIRNQIGDKNAEMESLRGQLEASNSAAVKNEAGSLRLRISELESLLEFSDAELNSTRNELKEKKEALERLQLELDESRQFVMTQPANSVDAEVEDLRLQLRELEDFQKHYERELDSTRNDLANKEDELVELKQKMDVLQNSSSSDQQFDQQSVSWETQQRLVELETVSQQYQSDLELVRAELVAKDVELEQLKSEMEKLRGESVLETLKAVDWQGAAEERIRSLQTEVDRLTDELQRTTRMEQQYETTARPLESEDFRLREQLQTTKQQDAIFLKDPLSTVGKQSETTVTGSLSTIFDSSPSVFDELFGLQPEEPPKVADNVAKDIEVYNTSFSPVKTESGAIQDAPDVVSLNPSVAHNTSFSDVRDLALSEREAFQEKIRELESAVENLKINGAMDNESFSRQLAAVTADYEYRVAEFQKQWQEYLNQSLQTLETEKTNLIQNRDALAAEVESLRKQLEERPAAPLSSPSLESEAINNEKLANDYTRLSELYEQQRNEVDQLSETLNQSAAVIEEWNSAYGQLAKDRDGKLEEIVTLSTKIARLEDAVALNEAALVELRTEREKLAGNLQQSELLVGKLNAEISDISARYAAVIEVNDQLKSEHDEQIRTLKSEIERSSVDSTLNEELERLNSTVAFLQSSKADCRCEQLSLQLMENEKSVESLKEQIEKLTLTGKNIPAIFDQLVSGSETLHSNEFEDETGQLDEMYLFEAAAVDPNSVVGNEHRLELSDVVDDKESLLEDRARLQVEIFALQEERDRLLERLEILENGDSAVRQTCAAPSVFVDQTSDSPLKEPAETSVVDVSCQTDSETGIGGAEAATGQLEQLVQPWMTYAAELEQRNAQLTFELDSVKTAYNTLEEQQSSTIEAAASLKELQLQCDRLSSECDELRTANQDLRQKLESAEETSQRVRDMAADSDGRVQELVDQIVSLQEMNDELQFQLAMVSRKPPTAHVSCQTEEEGEVESVQLKAAAIEQSLNERVQQLSSEITEKDTELRRRSSRLAELETEVMDLSSRLSESEARLEARNENLVEVQAERNRLAADLVNLEAEKMELSGRLEASMSTITELRVITSNLSAEKQVFESNARNIEVQLLESRKHAADAETEIQHLKADLDHLRNEMTAKEDEVTRLQKRLSAAKKRIGELEEKLSEEALKASQENGRLTEQVTSLFEGLQEALDQRDALKKQVRVLEEEIEILRDDLLARQEQHDSFREKVVQEALSLDQEIQDLREHLQARDDIHHQLTLQMSELKSDRENLKAKLQTERERYKEAKAALKRSEGRNRQTSLNSSVNGDGSVQSVSGRSVAFSENGSPNSKPQSALKACMTSLKSEIEDLKAQMDLHLQVVKRKQEKSSA